MEKGSASKSGARSGPTQTREDSRSKGNQKIVGRKVKKEMSEATI